MWCFSNNCKLSSVTDMCPLRRKRTHLMFQMMSMKPRMKSACQCLTRECICGVSWLGKTKKPVWRLAGFRNPGRFSSRVFPTWLMRQGLGTPQQMMWRLNQPSVRSSSTSCPVAMSHDQIIQQSMLSFITGFLAWRRCCSSDFSHGACWNSSRCTQSFCKHQMGALNI